MCKIVKTLKAVLKGRESGNAFVVIIFGIAIILGVYGVGINAYKAAHGETERMRALRTTWTAQRGQELEKIHREWIEGLRKVVEGLGGAAAAGQTAAISYPGKAAGILPGIGEGMTIGEWMVGRIETELEEEAKKAAEKPVELEVDLSKIKVVGIHIAFNEHYRTSDGKTGSQNISHVLSTEGGFKNITYTGSADYLEKGKWLQECHIEGTMKITVDAYADKITTLIVSWTEKYYETGHVDAYAIVINNIPLTGDKDDWKYRQYLIEGEALCSSINRIEMRSEDSSGWWRECQGIMCSDDWARVLVTFRD
jgi:hypothetical protein